MINETIEFLLRWILGMVILKNLPHNLYELGGITTAAISIGFILAILSPIIPGVCKSIRNSVLLVIATKILTL